MLWGGYAENYLQMNNILTSLGWAGPSSAKTETQTELYFILHLFILMSNMIFYVEDGSTKLLLYVILHLFILMPNMIFMLRMDLLTFF